MREVPGSIPGSPLGFSFSTIFVHPFALLDVPQLSGRLEFCPPPHPPTGGDGGPHTSRFADHKSTVRENGAAATHVLRRVEQSGKDLLEKVQGLRHLKSQISCATVQIVIFRLPDIMIQHSFTRFARSTLSNEHSPAV